MGLLEWFGRKSAERGPTVPATDRIWEQLSATPQDLAANRYAVKLDQQQLILRCAGYVNICASLRASYAANVPIRLYRKVGRGAVQSKTRRLSLRQKSWLKNPRLGKAAQHADMADDVVEVLDSPVLALIQNPNPEDTGVEFRRLDYFLEDITGNTYWLKVRDGARFPIYLRTLFPQNTAILPSGPDQPGLIMGYGYGRSGARKEVYAYEDVAHFRYMPSPVSPYYGVGPLHGITTESDTAAAAAQYELNLLNNSQRPDFAVILTPGSGDGAADQVKAFFERRHRGVSKVGAPLVGTDFKIEPLNFPMRDMQFVERNKAAQKAIWDGFGMCGMLEDEGGSIQIGAGGQDAKEMRFYRQTITPKVAAKCEGMSERLLPDFGMEPGEFWFGFDNPCQEDDKVIVDTNVALCNAGLKLVDEARAEMGMEPLPDGMGAIPRYNGQPMSLEAPQSGFGFGGVPMMLPGSGGTPMNLPGSGATPMNLPGASGGGTPMMLPAGGDENSGRGPGQGMVMVLPKSLQSRQWIEAGHAHKSFDPSPFATREQMRDLIARVQAWVQSITPTVYGDQVQFDVDAVMRAFATTAGKPIADTFTSGWAGGADAVPTDTMTDPNRTLAQQFADQHVIRLARPVTESVLDRMNQILRESVDAGVRGPDVASAIQDAMGGEAYYIADRIARTELANAYQFGEIEAWRQSGAVIGKRFVPAAGACPLCMELARMLGDKVIPLDQPIVPMGTTITAAGRTQVFDFGDVQTGITHPNCRCSIEPVMEGEQ